MVTPHADGPDIAHYQVLSGPFDPAWRLGTAKCSEGERSGDATFGANFAWMAAARWRGGYHWLRSDSTIQAQATNFVARIRRATGTTELPVGVMLQTDWEVTPNIPLVTSDQVIEFNDRLRQAFGRECVVTYSSDWLPDSTLDTDSRGEFLEWRQARPNDPLWYANYNTSNLSYGGWAECAAYNADIWQWTSTYKHPSIVGGFDMNHVFNPAVLDRITGRNEVPTPTPTPTPPEDDMTTLPTPIRIYDSRQTRRLTAGEVLQIPIMANSIRATVTVVGADTDGFLTAWGQNPRPGTSDVQLQAGRNTAGTIEVVLDAGILRLSATAGCHVLVDLKAAA